MPSIAGPGSHRPMTTDPIQTIINHHTGFLTLNRPEALNALSLEMIRLMTKVLSAWRDDDAIHAVVVQGAGTKAFCAGGDIRAFYTSLKQGTADGRKLLDDFFTEEYALNHLIHAYPKPYFPVMDGIVMGGGMGIAQVHTPAGLRIVTERTRMAMPEVNIGLFPDVGGSFFLTRTPGAIGTYLGITGNIIGASDALYAGLADIYVPSGELPALMTMLADPMTETGAYEAVRTFAHPFRAEVDARDSLLAMQRIQIDRHFNHDELKAIMHSLAQNAGTFAEETLAALRKRSPLMMCVTLEQLRRGARMDFANCLRMERGMIHRAFEHHDALEGIRTAVIDKGDIPRWQPETLEMITPETIAAFFAPVWPSDQHPLRNLR